MASIPVDQTRRVAIGRVFNRAFATIGANPVTMFGIAFLFGALPTALINVVVEDERATLAFSPAAIALSVGVGLLTVAFFFLAQGALVRAVAAQSDGRRASFGESALAGVRKIVPLFVLALLLGLGVMIGFMLLIVPGIILYLVWSVAAPALVEENAGIFEAFSRSAFLTKGARWSVFGVQLVALLIYWAISAAAGIIMLLLFGVQGLATAAQNGSPLFFVLISLVSTTMVLTIVSAIQTSLYVELRDWKDGPAVEALSDIFG